LAKDRCTKQPVGPSSVAAPRSIAAAMSTGSIVVSPTRFGKRTPGVIFVTSQGLYYDTFVVADSRDAAVPADLPA